MNDVDKTIASQTAASQDAIDKLDSHHRQQLSALLDGALPVDESRFLWRRLQHDHELLACWERWQLAGDVLRGQTDGALLPAGFAERVASAVACEQAPAQPGRSRGAVAAVLAASLALVAVLVVQRLPQGVSQDREAGTQGAVMAPVAAVLPAPGSGSTTQGQGVGAVAPGTARPPPLVADAVPTRDNDVPTDARVPAVATVPQIAIAKAADTAQVAIAAPAPRQGITLPDSAPLTIAAATRQSPDATGSARPFTLPATLPEARPWPRTSVSDGLVGGAFTASYGTDSGDVPESFYPFEPNLSVLRKTLSPATLPGRDWRESAPADPGEPGEYSPH